MQSVLVRTISESAKQLARLYALAQNERTVVTNELLAYLKRVSVRYKIMTTYLIERLEDFERTPSTLSQSELLEAAMTFKQDSEVFASAVNPIITLCLCEAESRKDKLLVIGEYQFDVAFKLAKAIAFPLGVQAVLDNKKAPSTDQIITMLNPGTVADILKDDRLDEFDVKVDLVNALEESNSHVDKKTMTELTKGRCTERMNVDYLYSRKILNRIYHHYEV